MSERDRNERCSALRTLARVLDADLVNLPADPPVLHERLAGASPAAAGVKTERWRNVLSLVFTSLHRCGITKLRRRHGGQFSPPWFQLWKRLDAAIPLARGLSRFLHWLDENSIAPAAVDMLAFARFERALRDADGEPRARRAYALTCRSWNKAAQTIGGWPQLRVEVPVLRSSYSLEWGRFPSSLRDDFDRYAAGLSAPTRSIKELLDAQRRGEPVSAIARETSGRRKRGPLRPRTIELRGLHVRFAASAMVHRGVRPETLTTLADLVRPENVGAAAEFYLSCRNGSLRGQPRAVLITLLFIARDYVKAGHDAVDFIGALVRDGHEAKRGLTAKNIARMRQFDDPTARERLVNFPIKALTEALRRKPSVLKDAYLARTAVMVEILLMTAMRRDNMLGLDLQRHFQWSRPDRDGKRQCRIVIAGAEVKNDRPLEYPLPESLIAMIGIYVQHFRPIIYDGPGTLLFPTKSGAPCAGENISVTLPKVVKAWTGVQLHIHGYRQLIAKLHLIRHPGDVETLRRGLGHSTINTTTAHYVGGEMANAVQLFDESVLRWRSAVLAADQKPSKRRGKCG